MSAAITAKAYRGINMEGRIATWYARNTARDLPEYLRLAERIDRWVPAPGRVLEVAPGPGYAAVALAQRGRHAVSALDISHTFVNMVQARAREAGVTVDAQQGDAAAMPFPDASFDFVVCRAAFKNFTRPLQAIDEMHRVLRPGGRALIIDLRKEASLRDIADYLRTTGTGLVDAWITRLIFRFLLIPRAYTEAQFRQFAADSAFPDWDLRVANIGVELELCKAAVGA